MLVSSSHKSGFPVKGSVQLWRSRLQNATTATAMESLALQRRKAMRVTVLSALLVPLVIVLAGVGPVTYRLAAWQRQAQDSLKRALVEADAQRERLFAVLRSVPHGLLVLDERGRVAVANEQAAALWELADGEIAGLSFCTLEQPEAFRLWGIPPYLGD